jgi:hypothetical protein
MNTVSKTACLDRPDDYARHATPVTSPRSGAQEGFLATHADFPTAVVSTAH